MKLIPIPIIIITSIFLMLLPAGCGKKQIPAGSPAELIDLLQRHSGKEEIVQLYTKNTIDQYKRFVKLSGIEKSAAYSVLSFIPERGVVEIAGEKYSGGSCLVTVRFIDHPVENMKGFTIDLKMDKENDLWRIDRAEDFSKMADSVERGGAGDYFKNLQVN